MHIRASGKRTGLVPPLLLRARYSHWHSSRRVLLPPVGISHELWRARHRHVPFFPCAQGRTPVRHIAFHVVLDIRRIPHLGPVLADLARDGLPQLLDRVQALDLFPLVKYGRTRGLVRLVVICLDVGVIERLDDVEPRVGVKGDEVSEQVDRYLVS